MIINAKNITRSYVSGEVETKVLKGIDFAVEAGEFVAIMGRSGAGKSTLLYQLSLLDVPNTGIIVIDGRRTDHMDSEERTQFRLDELGYVFQDYAILPELTAYENVVLPLLMKGMDPEEAKKQVMDALDKMGLADKWKNLPSQLSGGEQQRVSIARAITHNPKILFADEPTANLDGQTAKKIIEIFNDLNEAGQTIVMVTHEKQYTKNCNRIVDLDDGVIVKEHKLKKSKKK